MTLALSAPFPRPRDTGFGGESAGAAAPACRDVFPDLPAAVWALYGFHHESLTGTRDRAQMSRTALAVSDGDRSRRDWLAKPVLPARRRLGGHPSGSHRS